MTSLKQKRGRPSATSSTLSRQEKDALDAEVRRDSWIQNDSLMYYHENIVVISCVSDNEGSCFRRDAVRSVTCSCSR